MIRFSVFALSFVTFVGCSNANNSQSRTDDNFSAIIKNKSGEDIGEVSLRQTPGGLGVIVKISGISPGKHGMHLHEFGTCTPPDFKSAGGHINPMKKAHGLRNEHGPDNADLPNLDVKLDGTAIADIVTPRLSLSGKNNVPTVFDKDGSALVIHEFEDDQISQPIGGAGPRIACAEIRKK